MERHAEQNGRIPALQGSAPDQPTGYVLKHTTRTPPIQKGEDHSGRAIQYPDSQTSIKNGVEGALALESPRLIGWERNYTFSHVFSLSEWLIKGPPLDDGNDFAVIIVKIGKIERLTNYGSVNRSQLGIGLRSFHPRRYYRPSALSPLADATVKVVSPVYR